MTDLFRAISNNDIEVVREGIKNSVALTYLDVSGNTLMHRATMNNNIPIMRLLIGAAKEMATARNEGFDGELRGGTSLHVAAETGTAEMIDLLLGAGADIKEEDESKNTPLHISIMANNLPVTLHLLELDADVEERNGHDWTPLHAAASYSGVKTVEALLDAGAMVNATNQQGRTALSLLSSYNRDDRYVSIATALVDAGAGINRRDGVCGDTPLRVALTKDKKEKVAWLIENGADIKKEDVDAAFDHGHTDILHLLKETLASREKKEIADDPLKIEKNKKNKKRRRL